MTLVNTPIPDLMLIEPTIHEDNRGYFFESYNKKVFLEQGIDVDFVQDNRSRSECGVLRGLHYQLDPCGQAKLVSVIKGEVFDVAVDIRKGSPTFRQWYGTMLSEKNKNQLFIPRGFAHGFLVVSEFAEFAYKCDNYYSPEHEAGIAFNDKDLNIDWPFDQKKMIISDRDKGLPLFNDAANNFSYQN